MNTSCRLEPDAVRAASSGEWTVSLRAHVDNCTDCAAAAEVGPWMEEFARLDDREHILPDPAVLWLKAKLMQSNATMQRASLPMTRLQIGAYLAVAACWASLLTWKWSAIQAWVTSFTPSHMVMASASAQATASLSVSVFAAVVVLSSATVFVAMHTILAEE
ncbi:MAG: hypothetical protein AABO58_12045 [Acidobacteriota bacterium]